jgi:hypothetical protein
MEPWTCRAKGQAIAAELVGELAETDALEGDAPRRIFAAGGYVLIRGALPRAAVAAAREEVFARLAAVDEIAPPAPLGIATGRSARRGDLGAFWKSVSEGQALRAVTHGAALRRVAEAILGEPAVPHDLVYLRAAAVGRSLDLHYDFPFFCRLHDRVVTTWIPLGEVPVGDGPIYVVEGSTGFTDLLADVTRQDALGDRSRKFAYEDDPGDFARRRGARLLTADFRPGDVLVFGMRTAHGSLDNCSPIGRTRLSCDLRFQPARLPRDPAFFGDDPRGVTGGGYADLNGAKPLTASWKTN